MLNTRRRVIGDEPAFASPRFVVVLDAEVQRMTWGLQVLTLTNALRDGDLNGFRRIVDGFLEPYGKDGVVLARPMFLRLLPQLVR